MQTYPKLPKAPTPSGRRVRSADCSNSVISAVGPGTLSATSTISPVSSSTAICLFKVCCFFCRLIRIRVAACAGPLHPLLKGVDYHG